LNDAAGAIGDESEILARHSGNLPALHDRAALLMGEGRDLEAVADFDAILRARPNDGEAYRQRGVARWRSLGEAATPSSPEKDEGFAMLQRMTCRDVRANCEAVKLTLADLGRAVDLLDGEERAAALSDRAQVLADRGETQKALADLDDAVRSFPESADLHAERSRVRRQAGNLADAQSDLDEAVRLEPNDARYRFERAQMRVQTGDDAGARADLDVALNSDTSVLGEDALAAAVKLRAKIALPNEQGFSAELRDLKIASVSVPRDARTGAETIAISLDPDATRRFATFTKLHLGSLTEMSVDGMVLMRPVIREPITGGSLTISGRFTHEEALAIAKHLSAPGATMTVKVLE
jgi:tetratricopeptide (TPR) repeat protein